MISFYSNDMIDKIGFLTLIVVNKDNSNVGIGSKLINFAEEYCRFQSKLLAFHTGFFAGEYYAKKARITPILYLKP